MSASCGCYRAGDLPSSFPIKLVQPPPPPTHPPAEALAKHFDPQHIDDSLGGHIPIEQLFDYEGYGERMKAMDAQVCVCVGGWVGVVVGGGARARGRRHVRGEVGCQVGGWVKRNRRCGAGCLLVSTASPKWTGVPACFYAADQRRRWPHAPPCRLACALCLPPRQAPAPPTSPAAQAAAVLAAAQAEADAAEAAAAEAAKARRPSDSAAELDAEFERHVVDI